jgi:hypothetical protein
MNSGSSLAVRCDQRGSSDSTPTGREVEAVINRLRQLIGPRLKRGGGREMTPEEEVSAEPSAEEPSAEEQAAEEPATSEALAEEATEAAPAEEPAAEEAPAEEEPTA